MQLHITRTSTPGKDSSIWPPSATATRRKSSAGPSPTTCTELVADALLNAAATTLIEPDAIWHSDRGSVYTSAEFQALVTGLGMRSSMGRTGVCWDNSMAESFFSMLKNERVYRTVYATKSQARSDVIRYIEGFYNSRRRHSALGYRRPNEVHYGYQQPALAA